MEFGALWPYQIYNNNNNNLCIISEVKFMKPEAEVK